MARSIVNDRGDLERAGDVIDHRPNGRLVANGGRAMILSDQNVNAAVVRDAAPEYNAFVSCLRSIFRNDLSSYNVIDSNDAVADRRNETDISIVCST